MRLLSMYTLILFVSLIITSCVCDCEIPCDGEIPVNTILEEDIYEWFEFYENSTDTLYENKLITERYFVDQDSTIRTERIDTLEFITTSSFIEDAQCHPFCPSVCEKLEGNIISPRIDQLRAQVKIEAGGLLDTNSVAIEIIILFPLRKSYQFSMDDTGNVLDNLQVFDIDEESNGFIYTAALQEEIERIEITEIPELNHEGVIYNQCYQMLDAISFDTDTFRSFKFILCKDDGPILFERQESFYFPELNKTQFDWHTIKKIN